MRWIRKEGTECGFWLLALGYRTLEAMAGRTTRAEKPAAKSQQQRSHMKLAINGESREFPDGLTLAALVAQLGMKADRVAVELNLEIVPRDEWKATQLRDGDRLEIVHFVGGGSGERNHA